ncbi:hypothetical protein [Thalassococcus profundi]|mgnify:FL=1|uniref:hypothetical protein n=1 Tax=Thalassococcus profundi TaxID=2282382 RepID=UPI0013142DE2|nr:hypothetical protein [Thalassococcus profundi]
MVNLLRAIARIYAPTEACGPLCRQVAEEVASMRHRADVVTLARANGCRTS